MKSAPSPSFATGSTASVNRTRATAILTQWARPVVLAGLACFCLAATAQTDEWVWMGGSSTLQCNDNICAVPGEYGALGTPASGNIPGSRAGAQTWSDSRGHQWLFGGFGFDANGTPGALNDLWEFIPSTNEWAWMGGSSTVPEANFGTGGQPGVYGTLGTPAIENIPGGRSGASSWLESNGNFWLFGGYGSDANGNLGYLNDLWEFNPSSHEWTWMGGSSTVPQSDTDSGGQLGVYGTLDMPAAKNIPGGRSLASSWIDSNGNFWYFGGQGYNATGYWPFLNDLWELNPSTHEWTWMSGSSTGIQNGVSGALGTPAPGNIPGSRNNAPTWTDSTGNLWLFGGLGYDTNGNMGYLNDLWELEIGTKEWAWMAGTSAFPFLSDGQPGVYGTLGVSAAGNTPGGREAVASWTDSSGRLWLFGGWVDSLTTSGVFNDLWQFNHSTKQWTWMAGSSTVDSDGAYGKLGVLAAGNVPGGRQNATRWIDSSGNLWLFGGQGYDADGNFGNLNDLWEYRLSSPLTPAAKPEFNVATGTYTSAQTLKIADSTSGAKIYYTLDGTTPTIKSTRYTAALTIAKTTTMKAIAEAAGYANSAVATAIYTILKAQSITFTAPASPVTYGVRPIPLVAKASSGLAVTFKVVSGPATVSLHQLNIIGAGSVVVEAIQAGNGIYAPATEVKQTLTVNKATLPVKANNLSMKQGAAVPTLTYTMTGFVDGDTQAKATTGVPALSTTATSKSTPGTYPITVKAGTLAAKNYTFTFTNGVLTVTQ